VKLAKLPAPACEANAKQVLKGCEARVKFMYSVKPKRQCEVCKAEAKSPKFQ